jgi:hypothetical protein
LGEQEQEEKSDDRDDGDPASTERLPGLAEDLPVEVERGKKLICHE